MRLRGFEVPVGSRSGEKILRKVNGSREKMKKKEENNKKENK